MSMFTQRHNEAFRSLLLARRVERAIWWLNQHAPPRWHRNFFDPLEERGTCQFRARSSYHDECPLALAFETLPLVADKFGYVNEASVTDHFNLSEGWLVAHAFRADKHTTSAMLDAAWETALRTHRLEWRDAIRHPTPLDREFGEIDFSFGPPKGRLRRILAGVPVIGKLA